MKPGSITLVLLRNFGKGRLFLLVKKGGVAWGGHIGRESRRAVNPYAGERERAWAIKERRTLLPNTRW